MPGSEPSPILVDATGVIRWGVQPCTGVQRVELGLCEYALDNPQLAKLCVLDPAKFTYVAASSATENLVRRISQFNSGQSAVPHSAPGIGEHIAALRFADNESARRIASEMLGTTKRTGLLYTLTKLIVRMVIWTYAALRFLVNIPALIGRVLGWKSTGLPANPSVLVSHEVNRSALIEIALDSINAEEINIIYDLIPVRYTHLVTQRFATKMAGLLNRIGRKGNVIITISRFTRKDLLAWYDEKAVSVDHDRICACQLNSSLGDKGDEDRPIVAVEGVPFAVFCSSVDLRKCQWVLVDAWEQLAQTLPPDRLPHLVLIGRKGSGWGKLEEALARLVHAADKVHYVGGVSDEELRWAYRNADFCLFPSLAEGWGLGVSEAMAYGKPVVHSDIEILSEAAQDLMPSAPPGDIGAWVDVLHALMAEPEQLETLKQTIADHYVAGTPSDFAACVFGRVTGFETTGERP